MKDLINNHGLRWFVAKYRVLLDCKTLIRRLNLDHKTNSPILSQSELTLLEDLDNVLAQTTPSQAVTLCKAAGIDEGELGLLFNLYRFKQR